MKNLTWLEWLLEDDQITVNQYNSAIRHDLNEVELLYLAGFEEREINYLACKYIKESEVIRNETT